MKFVFVIIVCRKYHRHLFQESCVQVRHLHISKYLLSLCNTKLGQRKRLGHLNFHDNICTSLNNCPIYIIVVVELQRDIFYLNSNKEYCINAVSAVIRFFVVNSSSKISISLLPTHKSVHSALPNFSNYLNIRYLATLAVRCSVFGVCRAQRMAKFTRRMRMPQ